MKPIIGITMGDPAGIGPEIVCKALADPALYDICRPLVIGDAGVLSNTAQSIGASLTVRSIGEVQAARFRPGEIDVCDLGLNLRSEEVPIGQVSAAGGHAAFCAIEAAVRLAQQRYIDAICTAPINKEALHLAGHRYPGHTEILAELTGTTDYAMMLMTPKLRVVHLTTHVGLIEAINRINPERTYKVIRIAHETLTRAGIREPRIAVCGINPHAGENGLFGNGEEAEKLVPGIERAAAEGIDATGPYPADTLFYRAARGDFDMVVACYHDQGHTPVKVMGIEAGVNITVGLRGGVVRTSVDHGTAFDIAGRNTADPRSMLEAIRAAVQLSRTRE